MKFYSILEGKTEDVLRRFLRLIRNSQADIEALEADIEALEARVEALENPTQGEGG